MVSELKYLLLDMPCFQTVTMGAVTASGTTFSAVFTLTAPARVTSINVKVDACLDGCYPYVPASAVTQTVSTVPYVSTPANVLVETDECSNRGTCDRALGQCNCFTGHYGLACQYQTVLV